MSTVKITSQTHAMALVLYLGAAILGLLHFTDQATASKLEEWIGPVGYFLWAWSLVIAGLLALLVCLHFPYWLTTKIRRHLPPSDVDEDQQHARMTIVGLYLEGPAATVIAMACGLYEASLIADFGRGVATTQTFALIITVGGVARAVQIIVELLRVRWARTKAV